MHSICRPQLTNSDYFIQKEDRTRDNSGPGTHCFGSGLDPDSNGSTDLDSDPGRPNSEKFIFARKNLAQDPDSAIAWTRVRIQQNVWIRIQ
jgi:hypothetical protein